MITIPEDYQSDEGLCRDIKDEFIKTHYKASLYNERTLEGNLADLMECVDIPVLCSTIIKQLQDRLQKHD